MTFACQYLNNRRALGIHHETHILPAAHTPSCDCTFFANLRALPQMTCSSSSSSGGIHFFDSSMKMSCALSVAPYRFTILPAKRDIVEFLCPAVCRSFPVVFPVSCGLTISQPSVRPHAKGFHLSGSRKNPASIALSSKRELCNDPPFEGLVLSTVRDGIVENTHDAADVQVFPSSASCCGVRQWHTQYRETACSPPGRSSPPDRRVIIVVIKAEQSADRKSSLLGAIFCSGRTWS